VLSVLSAARHSIHFASETGEMALLCSVFLRSSAFMYSAISLETPASLPLLTSALLPQSFKVCGAKPIFEENGRTVCQRDPCRPCLSNTNRTARSRTSGENLFVVLLVIFHSTQKLEPPANPERFKKPLATMTSFGGTNMIVATKSHLLATKRSEVHSYNLFSILQPLARRLGKYLELDEKS
jgi:hypothetical protein